MKRLLLASFSCLLLLSCVSAPAEKQSSLVLRESTVSVSQVPFATVGLISPIYLDFEPYETIAGMPNHEGFDSFKVSIENTSDSVIKIIWANSAVVYGGKSFVPYLPAQSFSDAGKPASPTVIPPHTTITQTIFSSDQVKYFAMSGKWGTNNIPEQSVTITLCLESNGKEEYPTISIALK